MATDKLQVLGKFRLKRTELTGTGNVAIQISDGEVYYVRGYTTVEISFRDDNFCTAHLFVTFPDTAEDVGFVLPDGLQISGHDPSTAAAGEQWEISVDSVGGALFMRKTVLS